MYGSRWGSRTIGVINNNDDEYNKIAPLNPAEEFVESQQDGTTLLAIGIIFYGP